MTTRSDSQTARAPWPHLLLYILGGMYLFTLLMAMTPETHQLDDAKMLVVYILGPTLTVV